MTISERKRKPKVFRKVFRMLHVDSDRYVEIANSSQGKISAFVYLKFVLLLFCVEEA